MLLGLIKEINILRNAWALIRLQRRSANRKRQSLLELLKRWQEKIRILIRDFIDGIENLITWFPIIWNDKPWDHIYIYYILRKKLFLMEKFYSSGNTFCVNAPRTLKEIKTCRILLDRLIKDDYIPDAFLDEKDHKKCKRMLEHSDMQNKQDVDLLFRLMKKHIRTWWD